MYQKCRCFNDEYCSLLFLNSTPCSQIVHFPPAFKYLELYETETRFVGNIFEHFLAALWLLFKREGEDTEKFIGFTDYLARIHGSPNSKFNK